MLLAQASQVSRAEPVFPGPAGWFLDLHTQLASFQSLACHPAAAGPGKGRLALLLPAPGGEILV